MKDKEKTKTDKKREEVHQVGHYQRKREEGGIGGKDEAWLAEQIQQGEGHEEVGGGREAGQGGDN